LLLSCFLLFQKDGARAPRQPPRTEPPGTWRTALDSNVRGM